MRNFLAGVALRSLLLAPIALRPSTACSQANDQSDRQAFRDFLANAKNNGSADTDKVAELISEQRSAVCRQLNDHEVEDRRCVSRLQRDQPIVGRYILLYQPDPVAVLKKLMTHARSGGRLVFHELDFGEPPLAFPEAPLWRKSWFMMAEAFRRSGTPPDFGMRIALAFLDAGLPYPTFQAEVPMVAGPDSYIYGWVAETLRSLMPRIEQYGLSTAAEMQIDTLASRLKAEAVELGAQLSGPMQVGAWVTLP